MQINRSVGGGGVRSLSHHERIMVALKCLIEIEIYYIFNEIKYFIHQKFILCAKKISFYTEKIIISEIKLFRYLPKHNFL